MKLIFLITLILFIWCVPCQLVYAQEFVKMEATIIGYPDAIIKIDGNADDWWYSKTNEITRVQKNETPTIEKATWRGFWNSEGIYILVEVQDDIWMPWWMAGENGNSWNSDKVELYFDVSVPQQDGFGPDLHTNKGNWQVAPDISMNQPGQLNTEDDGVIHAETYDGLGAYTVEYFVPFTKINKSGEEINHMVTNIIGFDVNIVDRDIPINDSNYMYGRNRLVWSNTGVMAESWVNCDDVGLITFEWLITSDISDVLKNPIINSNLSNNVIHLKIETQTLSIFNSLGQKLKQLNGNFTEVNISDLNTGIYIIAVETKNGEIITEKFVKK